MSQEQSVKYTTKSLLEQICLDLLLPLFTLREKRVSSNYPTLWKVWSRSLADSGLNRTRRQITPILPTSQDFDIPLFYQQTTEGKRFLLADRFQRVDGEIVKRMIVFATDEQLRLLCSCSHIIMDGTLDSSPPNFEQIYSIHGIKNDQSKIAWSLSPSPSAKWFSLDFTCVLALLNGRSTEIYKDLLLVLPQHADRLNLEFRPAQITSDFEAALIKAVADEASSFSFLCDSFVSFSFQFPNARHTGCYFHFTQVIHRQIQTLGLSTAYRDDMDARSNARKLMALPLVPRNQIEIAFAVVLDKSPDSIKSLVRYFRRYWMCKVKISLWHVSDLDVRTNNSVEGELSHRSFRLSSE